MVFLLLQETKYKLGEERVYFILWLEFMEARTGIQAQGQELEVKTIEKHCLLVCAS